MQVAWNRLSRSRRNKQELVGTKVFKSNNSRYINTKITVCRYLIESYEKIFLKGELRAGYVIYETKI